jgi:hypothetical protein
MRLASTFTEPAILTRQLEDFSAKTLLSLPVVETSTHTHAMTPSPWLIRVE